VAQTDGAFGLELEDGSTTTAERVVVAAGLFPFPFKPPPFASLPSELVSHSAERRDLTVFSGKELVVVGAGQSALESAALLSEEGAQVELIARTPAVRWLASEDPDAPSPRSWVPVQPPPTDVGGRLSGWIAAVPDVFRRTPSRAQEWTATKCIKPAGAGWLRPRMSAVRVNCGHTVVSADPEDSRIRLTLDDGSTRLVDHVLLGTGYRIDVRRYPFLAPELAGAVETIGGYPVLRPGLESSVRGLHFVGAPAAMSFGPIMRFVVGTWYAAPTLTRRIAGERQRAITFAF
jgi:hypothetical protein